MKYLKKVSSLSFLILIVLFSCTFFSNFNFKKVSADNNDNIILSAFKVKKEVEVDEALVYQINGETSADALYNNLSKIKQYNSESENNIANNELVLLDNEHYCTLVTLMPNFDAGYTLSSLSASLKINGNIVQVQTYSIDSSLNNSVYIQAFDFSSLLNNMGVELTASEMDGLYEFEFTYSYSFYDKGIYKVENGSKSIKFYLLDQKEYLNKVIYSNVEAKNIFDANKIQNRKTTYFYNYNSKSPTISFDPNRFNLNMTYSYKDEEISLKGTYSLDNKGNILEYKLVSNNSDIIHDIIATKSDANTWKISLTQIGLYDISYEFAFKYNNQLTILNGENIASVVADNFADLSGSNIYIFGYETYYKDYANANESQNAKYEHFYTDEILTDFSNLVTSTTDLNNAKDLFNLAGENHAKTNQAQVKLNDYASLTNGYYYHSQDNFVTSTKFNYTNSTRFTESGQYVIVLQYYFSRYDELNKQISPSDDYEDVKFTQLIIFEIKNTTPSLNLKVGNELAGFNEEININGFTNKDVQISWESNGSNPFMLQPKLIFRKNDVVIEDLTIQTNSNMNFVSFSESANYRVELRYGLGYNTVIEKTFTIDKSEIDYSILFNFNSNGTHTSQKENELTVNNSSAIKVLNNSFALQISNKEIQENTITATYSYIPLIKQNLTASEAITKIGDKYYLRNGYELSTTSYENIDYSYVTSNSEITLTNKITANGLYKFTLKDKAENEKVLYVFLDNTSPVVLEIYENISSLSALTQDQLDLLAYKNSNLISENYTLILTSGKAIKLDTNPSSNIANEFIDLNNLTTGYFVFDNFDVTYKLTKLFADSESDVCSLNKQDGLFSIQKPASEVDHKYEITLTDYFKKQHSYQFELNTDKSLVMIWAKDKNENSLKRILPNSSTNKQEIYIRYQNDYSETDYEIASLTLKFYDFNDNYTGFNTVESKNFNLLDSSIANTNVVDNISGGFITNSYINAHYDKNAISVSQAGKYELIRTYKNGQSQTYTFFIDRYKPIERINSNIIVGENLIFKLGEKNLNASYILNYASSNQSIKTNLQLLNLPNQKYKYSESLSAFELSYVVSFLKIDGTYEQLFSGTAEEYNASSIFNRIGTYKITILDNSGNFIDFNLNYTDELVKGNFVTKDNNVISENNACTASNELYFSFETSENEYMYDIDIYNLELYADNLLILKTSKDRTTEYKGTLGSFDDEIVYYKSPYYSISNNLFKLTREKISSTRYKYTLTILDGNYLNNSNPLYVNGKSAEKTYRIKLTYNQNSSLFSEKVINIDHTSPTKNAETLINNDKFLTENEKTDLLNSIKNKDSSSLINFENYALAVDGDFTFETKNSENVKETSLIYYRKYNKYATNKTIENYQSLVPGDANYEGTLTNRYRFNANLQNDKGQQVYTNIATANINAPLKDIFGTEYGCYEIIEIDSAENYTIYTIYYLQANKIDVGYKTHTVLNGKITANNNFVEINDVNLEILNLEFLSENNNLADYVNITIKANSTSTLRLTASNIEGFYNSIPNFIEAINNILNSNNVSEYGNSYTITIQTRYGEPVVISYNEPQQELQLSWQEFENRFVVSIPQSQGATSIEEFYVYPAIKENNVIKVSDISLDRDSNEQSIIKTSSSTATVGGKSYIFTNTVSINGKQEKVYVYKIVWKDNFGRQNSTFKVIGIIDVHTLTFNGPTSEINNTTYTYQDAILSYQLQSYNLKMEMTNLDTSEIIEDFDFSQFKADAQSILSFNVLEFLTKNGVYDFSNNQVEFKITLTSVLEENGEHQKYEYKFIYYPLIPEIIFTDSSNGELQPAKNTDDNYETYLLTTSKNITVSFNNSIFPVSVNYSLTYLSNEQNITENYSNVKTDTTLFKIGSYVVTITNSLGHSVSYRFAIREASLYPYAVIVSELGVPNTEVSPSKTPIQITINGINKNIDAYYTIYETIIEVNADNNLYYKDVTNEANIVVPEKYLGFAKIFLIEPKNNILENNRIYIAVVKVPYTDDFLKTTSEEDKILNLYTSSSIKSEEINKYSFVVTEKSGAKLTLSYNYNQFEGNNISTKIYFNNKLVNISFEENSSSLYELNLTEAGTYDIYFEDLAGNSQLFKGNSFLRVIVLNKVIANLNGENYVDYQVFNTDVYLSVLQTNLYSTKSFSISALLNGQSYNNKITSSNGKYVFTEAGLYTVTLKAKYNSIDIETIIHFIILNPNVAYSSFSYVGLNGYTISKIEKNEEDITNDLKVFFKYGLEYERTDKENVYTNGMQTINANNIFLNSINLSSKLSFKHKNDENYDYITGSGKYKITVLIDNNSVLNSSTFTFNVWIREENVNLVIKPSIKEGETTTKAINITFNPYLIYTQIGECKIVANNIVLYTINSASINEKITIDLPSENTTYTVQLKSDENVEMSFAVTKKEPLSTVSIIVICIGSAILGAAIFIFFKLRIKMKVK